MFEKKAKQNKMMKKMFKILKVTKKGQKYIVDYHVCDEDGKLQDSEETQNITCIEDQIIEYRIFKDKIYQENEFEQIIKFGSLSKWLSKSMHFISYKMRTEKELRTYMKDSELTDEQVNSIIQKLYEYHFLDDDKYASCFISNAVSQGKGTKYIRYTLLEKGITNDLIDKYLADSDEEYQYSIIFEKMQKEVAKLTKYPLKKQIQKIREKLQRLGFSSSIIKKVISNLNFEEDITESIKKDYLKITSKTSDKNKIIQNLLSKGYEYQDIKKLI